jgi:choline dehydrogenase
MGQDYLTPDSLGWVRATSRDPHRKPAVRLNLLTRQEDIDALVRAVTACRAIAATPPLSDVIAEEITPGTHVDTPELLQAWIRGYCEHSYHPSCTARMGAGDGGVLDPRLRVRGVAHLRVADTSAFPTIIRANTNAAAILMGERCARFIQEEQHRTNQEGTRNGT